MRTDRDGDVGAVQREPQIILRYQFKRIMSYQTYKTKQPMDDNTW